MSKSKSTPSRPSIIPPDTTETLAVSPELAALFAAHGVDKVKPAKEPGEFTAKEFAAFRGVTTTTASNELLSMMEAGKVTRRLVLRAFIYRFVE